MRYTINRTPRLIFFLALFMCVQQGFASSKTDSLRKQLDNKKQPDSARVNIYAGLAWEFKNRNTNVDSILYYANEGLNLANAIKYTKGAAVCSMHIGNANILLNEFEKANTYLAGALPYFEQLPASKELNEIYHNLGLNYYMQTKFEPALRNFEKSRDVAAGIENSSRLARAHYYLADIHNDMGNFTNALRDYLVALELYEKGGKQNAASNCLTNIATVYAQLKDFKKAREFVEKSLYEFSRSDNLNEIYQNYANIGIVYSMMGEHDEALELFNKGLRLTDSVGDNYWKAVFLINIAEVYTSTDKPDDAVAAYKQVLEWNEKAQEVNFRLSAHSGMGRILYKQGNRKEGIAHTLAAFAMVKENRLKKLIMETARDLSEMYEQTGDYKKALEYTRIFNIYNDSIYNEHNETKMQQLQFDYELEKKQRQIEQLNKNKEIQKAKTETQKIVSGSLAAGLLLMGIILLLMYRNRLSEQRRKSEILKQNAEIQEQAAKLEELNGFKDKTFSVLAHDLRGPVNSITGAIQLFNDKAISPEEYAEMKPEINTQLNSLNLLLDNVLLWAKSHIQDGRAVYPAITNIYDLAEQNVQLLNEAAGRKHQSLINNVGRFTVAYCDAGQMDIVIRNLVMNAIKYTPNGGAITIDGEAVNDVVNISVKDTGVGMTWEQAEGLFTAKAGRNTYGTAGERGIGLGLLLCNEFVKVNNGSISVKSEPGKGSSFTVTLPLHKS